MLQDYDPACLVKTQQPPEPRKYEKITKRIQNPPPRVGPQKIRNKYTKKYENGNFQAIFVIFRYFFVCLGPDPGWGILYSFRHFFVFSGFRGLWALSQASGIVSLETIGPRIREQRSWIFSSETATAFLSWEALNVHFANVHFCFLGLGGVPLSGVRTRVVFSGDFPGRVFCH